MTDRYQSSQRQQPGRDSRSDWPRHRDEDEGRQFQEDRERSRPSFDWERNNRDERWQQRSGRGEYERDSGYRDRGEESSGAWGGQQDWQRSDESTRRGGREDWQAWEPSREAGRSGQQDYGSGANRYGGSSGRQSSHGSSNYGLGGHASGSYGGTDFGSANYYGDRGQGQQSGQDYKGRGPKGYQRSDERMKEDISERLSADPRIDASEVTVEVESGTVKLSGTVPERSMRYTMEEVCENCSGVKDVENNVRVARSLDADKSGTGGATSIGTGASTSGMSLGTSGSNTSSAGSYAGSGRDKTK